MSATNDYNLTPIHVSPTPLAIPAEIAHFETLYYLFDVSSLRVHNARVNAAYKNGAITKEKRDFMLDVEKGRDLSQYDNVISALA